VDNTWQRARIIPVVGTGQGSEREQRATSALLAVLSVVRPLSAELLNGLGAPRAAAAVVEAYIEPPFKNDLGKEVRPDGLLRVTYGSQKSWVALVEVKTGSNELDAVQLNSYIDLARREKYDYVLTVSNEIAPSEGVHPTAGLKVRKGSVVQVAHFSWTKIATVAARVRDRSAVEDKEQAWILDEILRYLEHASSGAMEFDDMGPNWVDVRDGARNSTLKRSDENVADIARRWDQLLHYSAMKLSSQIHEDVREVIKGAERGDAGLRAKNFAKELCETGTLSGELRVPRTVGDMRLHIDLRARTLAISTEIKAPEDKKAKGSITWLTRQLAESPGTLVIDSYPKNARYGIPATLAELREDSTDVAKQLPGDVAKFVVTMRGELGQGRKTGKTPGFVDSVHLSVSKYYATVLQRLTPYQVKAPQVSPREVQEPETELGSVTE